MKFTPFFFLPTSLFSFEENAAKTPTWPHLLFVVAQPTFHCLFTSLEVLATTTWAFWPVLFPFSLYLFLLSLTPKTFYLLTLYRRSIVCERERKLMKYNFCCFSFDVFYICLCCGNLTFWLFVSVLTLGWLYYIIFY